MAVPAPIDDARLHASDFLASIGDDDLVYFLCNVGDGDAQLVLVPDKSQGAPASHVAIVVDAGIKKKLPALLDDLVQAGRVGTGPGAIALVVATHPHADHILGIPEILKHRKAQISEFWEPGYYHPTPTYHQMMAEVENTPGLGYLQPTSGMRRWIGNAQLTVLAPSIGLRNRFDTYGVNVNDASISIRIDFPAARVVERDAERRLVKEARRRSLVLGADSQTLSWSYVGMDFPDLGAFQGTTPAAVTALKAAAGSDLLRANILKVSHHCSKHGVSLELVERIAPNVTLISSVAGGGSYNFPHTVAQEIVREALDQTTSSGQKHKADADLNIFYTSDTTRRRPEPRLVRHRRQEHRRDRVALRRRPHREDRPRCGTAVGARLSRRLGPRPPASVSGRLAAAHEHGDGDVLAGGLRPADAGQAVSRRAVGRSPIRRMVWCRRTSRHSWA